MAIPSTIRAWVRAAERKAPEEQWVLLCFIAGQSVELDEAERNAALRRAELLLAAGGDPRRPLELYGRAVTALADDLDDAARPRASSPPASPTLEPAVGRACAVQPRPLRLLGRDRRPGVAVLRRWPLLAEALGRRRRATRSVARRSAAERRPDALTAAARTIFTSPLTVRTRSSTHLGGRSAGGASLTSSSELIVPLTEVASMQSRSPGLIREMDVARDRLNAHPTAPGGVDAHVTRDRRQRESGSGLADR